MAFIRTITRITFDANGAHAQTLLRKKKKKKRKVSGWMKPIERAQRRALKAQNAYASELLSRHHKSNRKRKDGFARDGAWNQMHAIRKAVKKLD